MAQHKTKIAVLDLTGCTGCEVNFLRLGSAFHDFIQDFEITSWRMIHGEKTADYDVVFVEGYACNQEQVELLKEVRDTCGIVVAFGTCAISGNVFSQLKPENYEKLKAMVYSPEHQAVTQFVRPVSKVIKVDHVIPGCPANIDVVRKLLGELKKHPVTSKVKEVRCPDYVAKIEGHGSLNINFKEGTAHFYPEEGERFVEALVVGKPYLAAPKIHSRICGICPVAHCLCSIKAIEKALEVRPHSVTKRLRHLFHCGQMVQSHLLHLYFMVLPSLSGLQSSIAMHIRYPAEFHLCMVIKRVAEEIFDLIGGVPLHPVSLTVGGFTKIPAKDKLAALKEKILDALDEALDLLTLFAEFDWPEAISNAHLVCIQPEYKKSYPLFGAKIRLNDPDPFPVGKYKEFINEIILPGQPSKIGYLKPNKPVKTGALARLFYYSDRLNPLAGKAFARYRPNFSNPFHNNIAQAIEILHYLEEAVFVLDSVKDDNLVDAVVRRDTVRKKALDAGGDWPKRGVSAIEAPSPTL